ncbi:hypothetical protein POM88_025508 [Heracleum sosnowskyi]|uniref:Arogenate dehydratase n=1 Tax=Heracleum sosnowskyi TaxID=360622 RepID=A0AAD8I5E1_9APIA|nr:hypothetical protein POM88_025508 [Heracleum sosnowskyi]
MPSRKHVAAWNHGTEVEGSRKKVKCNYCSKVIGGITRMKQHLAREGKDVTGCPDVPLHVSREMRNNLLGVQQNVGQNAEIEGGGHLALALPQLKVAFKGVTGACSEEAALSVYPHCKMDPCETFEEALKAVESLWADKAIIPIENSLGGIFDENYDLIFSHRLHIVGEFEASMNFCLLARPDIGIEQLERVLGHSQALEQTKTFLSNLGVEKDILGDHRYYARLIPSHKENPTDSGSAQQPMGVTGSTQQSTGEVGMALQPTGVIGSAKAAELYKLRVVATGIHDEDTKESITRFWILARDPIVPTNDNSFKTSLVFTLKEGHKELCKALSVFSVREITVTKVESRPQRNTLPNGADSSTNETAECFNYLFHIDFEASMAESRAECAVRHLKEFATYVRILGSYPLIEVRSA